MLKIIISSTILATAIATQMVFPVAANPQPVAVSTYAIQASPEIKEALKKFAALNSRLKVGMNFSQYLNQVAELNVVLDEVPDEARKNPIYLKLSSALEHYKTALNVWQDYINESGRHNFFPASSLYGSLLIKNYNVRTTNISGNPFIYLNDALSSVWEQAGKNINEAKAN